MPERPYSKMVSVSGDYTRKIVRSDSDEKSLELAARFVLDKAIEVRASIVMFMLARANSFLELGF